MFSNIEFPNPNSYSSLVLAYIGDSIFDLYIRSKVIEKGNRPVGLLHKQTASYVRAKAQADLYHQIEGLLTPEEIAVYKRGRNAHSKTTPKNADVGDYRRATGMEALIGYLFIAKQYDRIEELLSYSFSTE